MNFNIDILRNCVLYALRMTDHSFDSITSKLSITDDILIQYLSRRSEVGWADLTDTQLTTLKNTVLDYYNPEESHPLRTDDQLLTEFAVSILHQGLRLVTIQNFKVSKNPTVLQFDSVM